ncbi:MAG: sulfatase-like hydrolase/transferase [Bacteroidales bacterium]|nr:sulfatase-like hydrolase/transferase [Bacteroidales bacterium]
MDIERQNKSTYGWWIFTFIALTIFIKSVVFQIFVAHLISFSSIWKAPLDFLLFYMPKLLPACFIASFSFLTRRHWWTIIVEILIDIWCIANLIYNGAYGLFLTLNEIFIANNLNGFWNSITPFFNLKALVFPLITLLYGLLLLFLKKNKNNENALINRRQRWIAWGIVIVGIELLSGYRYFYDKPKEGETPYWVGSGKTPTFIESLNPLYGTKNYIEIGLNAAYLTPMVVYHYSIVSYIPMIIGDYIVWQKNASYTPPTEKELSLFIERNPKKQTPQNNMYIILVESLESWTLVPDGIEGQVIAPNINKLINYQHTIYAPHVKSQAKAGNSGDGQMTILSGLLPISRGAACMRYGQNTYPSIAKLYSKSTIINPCPTIWNQHTMNKSYGFAYSCEQTGKTWRDHDVFEHLCQQCDSSDFVLAITVSSHLPFEEGSNGPLRFSNDIPQTIKNYLNCIHYMDSCLGMFLQKLEQDTNLKNSTIIITGDHTVFKKTLLNEFQAYAQKHNVPVPKEEGYLPLIIYSPQIEKKQVIDDTLYQMDIYPTLLHLSGCNKYYWKGFGLNILDYSLRNNRPINENDAILLSNKIITKDYFNKYKTNL